MRRGRHRPRCRSCPHRRQSCSTILAPLMDGRLWLVTLVGQRTLSIRRASQRLAIPNLTASHESIRLRGETPAPISSPLRRSPSMCTAHSIVARSAAHPRTGQPRMYGVRTPRPGTTGRTGTGQNYSENVALSWYGSALIGMGVDLPSTSDQSSIGMSED